MASSASSKKSKASTRGRQRSDAPRNYWHRNIDALEFGREEFRFIAVRKGLADLLLDDYVTAFDWAEDSKAMVSGTVTLRKPLGTRTELTPGDEVRCQVSPWGQGRWRELWRMNISEPEFALHDQTYTYQLTDALERLSKSKRDYRYRKDKQHPNGWFAHMIIADICKREGVKVGRIPKMKHRVTKMVETGISPTDMIQKVLTRERVNEGDRFFIRWNNGKLAIEPFQRSKELLLISGTFLEVNIKEALDDNFATVLDISGTQSKGTTKDVKGHKKAKKRKMKVTVRSSSGIERFGEIHRQITLHGESEADLRRQGNRLINKLARPKKELTFTHPGIPTLRRGHAIAMTIPEVAMRRQIVYVSDVKHSVASGGTYEMEVTIQFDDPFVNKVKRRSRDKRCNTARKRNRKTPNDCKKSGDRRKSHPRPAKAKQRSDA